MLHSFCEKNRRTTMTAAGCALVIVCLVAPRAGAAALRAAARPQRPVPSEKEARSSSPDSHSIIARVPVLRLERLAGGSAVRFIEPVARATTNDAK